MTSCSILVHSVHNKSNAWKQPVVTARSVVGCVSKATFDDTDTKTDLRNSSRGSLRGCRCRVSMSCNAVLSTRVNGVNYVQHVTDRQTDNYCSPVADTRQSRRHLHSANHQLLAVGLYHTPGLTLMAVGHFCRPLYCFKIT